MATKLKRLLKHDVVTAAEGRRLGPPEDILIDPTTHRVATIVLELGKVPETTVVVPASAVRSFATDTLAIDRLESITVAAHDPVALGLLTNGLRFRGRTVLTSTGVDLGKITQALVSEDGTVTEYRLRRGILGYLRPAKRLKPAELATAGREVAVTGRE